MLEKGPGISSRDLLQSDRDSILQCLRCADSGVAQVGFDLREGQLDRRIVGRVRRQIAEPTSTRRHNRLCMVAGMRAQIIDKHHLAWLQCRRQDLFQIDLEG